MKIYLSVSVRGGRSLDSRYGHMVAELEKMGHTVLTKHLADTGELGLIHETADTTIDEQIYETDMALLRHCDVYVSEQTVPSVGVGYELAYAEMMKRPVYVFYQANKIQPSAMVSGNPYCTLVPYITTADLTNMLWQMLGPNANKT